MAVDSQNSPSDERGLPGEVVEDLLASEGRRAMLTRLADSEGSVPVEDLARAVAERRGTDATAGSDERREVLDGIYERHLPKLMAAGVVEYDSMRGAVRLADRSLAETV